MPDKVRVAVTVNGTAHDVLVEPRTLLLDFLRDELALTGAHAGCEQGACGPAPCWSTASPPAPA
jgi:aerobic-type carbon monoxide dehydrogenase small subunit (CoxS/CutS family)